MPASPLRYRPAAGIALFNRHGQVFSGRRKGAKGPYVWQMPQGGIDDGETPREAAIRELEEETGIAADLVTPLGEIEDWLHYDFPPSLQNSRMAKEWCGQKQKWFAFRFIGQDRQIDLTIHEQIEFSDWRWDTLARSVALIVPFKRDVYERVGQEFSKFEK